MAKRQLRIVHDDARAPESASRAPLRGPGPAALEALLERGLRAIVALTGARGGAVRIVDEPSSRMKLVAASGVPEAWVEREREVDSDCGICGRALQCDSLQLGEASGPCASAFAACAREGEAGPTLALPLHCRGRPIGVFNLFFAPGCRDSEVASLVAPVADMLDLVIENAFLEQERLRSSLVAERQMLAAEVHDSLAQGLAYMRMRMTLLHDAIGDGDRARALKYFGDVNGSLGEAHARLRELITQFRAGIDHGLARALEGAARGFEERTGVALTVENRVPDLRLPPEQEVHVYRIVEEALANVVKHAGAASVRVRIERRAGRLLVSIEDDGRGAGGTAAPPPAPGSGHYGLEIMRERAHRIGGEIRIHSVARKGTRVRLSMPAPAPAGAR